MSELVVLVVEPSPATTKQIVCNLADRGVAIHSCETHEMASTILRQTKIDMLFSELRLPDGSGLNLLAEALALPNSAAFVAISARTSAEEVAELWRLGACDIVFKPITRHGLLAAFQRAAQYTLNPHTRLPQTVLATADEQAEDNSKSQLNLTIPLGGDYDVVQKHLVHETIRRFDGNKAAAARALGMHRRMLYRLLDR